MALFTIGAVLALAGMAMGRTWMVWTAAVILVVAFGLRFSTASSVHQDPSDSSESETRTEA